MNDIFSSVVNAWQAQSILEVIAVITSVVYLILAAREVVWCWLFGAISTVCYIYILWEVNLLAEMVLQFYYLFMAGYGFYKWSKRTGEKVDPPIVIHSLQKNLLYCGIIIAGTSGLGWSLNEFTQASMPYVDAFTTIGALVTTWMVTKKMLENWIYWIVVDGVGVYLYWQKQLYLTAFLFLLFVIMVVVGFVQWNKLYKAQEFKAVQ